MPRQGRQKGAPMRAVVTRVKHASVTIDGHINGQIGEGYLVLLGVAPNDTHDTAVKLADKICNLRIFEDENDKMNLSVADIGGGVMVVPNFTLLASYRKGNRPDYMQSAAPDEAKRLFEYFTAQIAKEIPDTTHGQFGADMKVSITNDGPCTIPMDSEVLKQPKRQ